MPNPNRCRPINRKPPDHAISRDPQPTADGKPQTRSTLARSLEYIQRTRSVTADELAGLLGVSLVTIKRWIRGIGHPSVDQRKAIDHLLAPPNSHTNRPDHPFQSRGAARDWRRSSQKDLFRDPPTVEFLPSPGPPLLSRIKTGPFFGTSRTLSSILAANTQPAVTPEEPVATPASAGKNTYTYDAHTYHTKVPPQGILEFLRHYLPEGGLVLDPFAGSGMTGVAARVGGYDTILNDLSPAACFIAHCFTETIDTELLTAALATLLKDISPWRQDLYRTTCRECRRPVEANYFIWSYRVTCYHCGTNFLLWDHARQYGSSVREHKILGEFACPDCDALVKKRLLPRTIAEPVMVTYRCCHSSLRHHPVTSDDRNRLTRIEQNRPFAHGYVPDAPLPDGINLNQPKRHGLLSVADFYTTRNLAALSHLWRSIHRFADPAIASAMAFAFTSLYRRVSRLAEFRFWGGSGNTARLNVPFVFKEANVFTTFERKATTILDHLETTAIHYSSRRMVICKSATDLTCLPDQSVDLIFTDPPFGSNINYSDMNFLWESWLGEFTDTTEEAIINRHQRKGLKEYGKLMVGCLTECHRVLRDDHWLLLVFMNSSAKVWQELKHAIRSSGFSMVRADIFDKQHGTFKHFVSPNTTGYDLVIHCRKAGGGGASPRSGEPRSAVQSIRRFLRKYPETTPTTVFLHVSRAEEIDYRWLYSEWIGQSVVTDDEVTDFSHFRAIAEECLAKDCTSE